MAYAEGNPKTKKQLKEWVKGGRDIRVFSPGPFPERQDGVVTIEGPHYPEPHKWYARCEIANGIIRKVVS